LAVWRFDYNTVRPHSSLGNLPPAAYAMLSSPASRRDGSLRSIAHGVTLDFSRPGKPTDNASVESLNGRLWDECLNAHWFLSVADAKAKIEAWRRQYHEGRPHTPLGWRTPQELALAAAQMAAE
jgi:putative transposase